MREILFRGKRNDTGDWIEGWLMNEHIIPKGQEFMVECINPQYFVDTDNLEIYEIIPETVGQYTGLTDKNRLTKIFEGDIVHWKKVPYFVRWDSEKAEFVFADDMDADYFVAGFNEYTTSKFCKVIGNVHDNPELLEGKA